MNIFVALWVSFEEIKCAPPSFHIFHSGCKTWTLIMFMTVEEWQASHTILASSFISPLCVSYFCLRQQKRCGARYISSILEKRWAQNSIYDCRMVPCRLDFEEKTSSCKYSHWKNALMTRLESLFRLCLSRDRIHKKRTVVPSFTDNRECRELLRAYKINKIQTTKYSFLSFLPKNLFEQLHRIANIYFILIATLNFVPVVEAFQPEIALIPIVFVLTVNMIRDIWEDYRRFNSDFFINRLPCHVFNR